MSPHPSPLHRLLLRVLRHLLLVLDGVLGAKLALLRARRDALPPGHRRHARMAGELRRLARLQVLLADPDLLEDAAFRGKAAEVARVCNDAGRRAMPRRRIHPAPLVRLSGGVAAEALERLEAGRCTADIAVALCAAGGLPGGGANACTGAGAAAPMAAIDAARSAPLPWQSAAPVASTARRAIASRDTRGEAL